MKSIKKKAEEYAKTKHTSQNLIEIVSWDFESGANYVLDEIEKVVQGDLNSHSTFYEPSNCRWVSYTEQANNTKANVFLTLNGESHTYAEWGRIVGIRSTTLQQRKYAGWSDERTLTTPVRKNVKSIWKESKI